MPSGESTTLMNGQKRQVSNRNYKVASLEQYQSDVLQEWPTNETSRPALYVWLHVVGHASNICEGIRRSEWKLVLDEAAALILWWLAFVGRLNSLIGANNEEVVFAVPCTPTSVIWQKYPRVCPVDLGLYIQDYKNIHNVCELDRITDKEWQKIWATVQDMKCQCISQKEKVENRSPDEKLLAGEAVKRLAVNVGLPNPRGIRMIENMFNDIFKSSIYVLSLQEIGFHFMEEVGEVSRALSDMTSSTVIAKCKGDKTKFVENEFGKERAPLVNSLRDELADVFSWATNIVAKMRLTLKPFDSYFEERHHIEKNLRTQMRKVIGDTSDHLNLADIIWERYGIGGSIKCHVCRLDPCICSEEKEHLLAREQVEKWMIQAIKKTVSKRRL